MDAGDIVLQWSLTSFVTQNLLFSDPLAHQLNSSERCQLWPVIRVQANGLKCWRWQSSTLLPRYILTLLPVVDFVFIFKAVYKTWKRWVISEAVKISTSSMWMNQGAFSVLRERGYANHSSPNKTIQEMVYSSPKTLKYLLFCRIYLRFPGPYLREQVTYS